MMLIGHTLYPLIEPERSFNAARSVGRAWFDLQNPRLAEGSLSDATAEGSFQRVAVPGARASRDLFAVVMGASAGISLLVGGIGIMNIMLASVLQRTLEMGVRRVAAAKRRDILSQFLLEAVLNSLLGGLMGAPA